MKKNGLIRIHAKRQYTFHSAKQIYVLRDGRDVLTSYYFHLFCRLKIPQPKAFQNIDDVRNNMPKYLELYFKKKLNNKILWHRHAAYWRPRARIIVRYEDLLDDTYGTSRSVIGKLTGQAVESERLKKAISDNDFTKLSGRRRGQEDQKSFFRKGIREDWKNYFNAESARIFNEHAGSTLIKIGYEKDDSWVFQCN